MNEIVTWELKREAGQKGKQPSVIRVKKKSEQLGDSRRFSWKWGLKNGGQVNKWGSRDQTTEGPLPSPPRQKGAWLEGEYRPIKQVGADHQDLATLCGLNPDGFIQREALRRSVRQLRHPYALSNLSLLSPNLRYCSCNISSSYTSQWKVEDFHLSLQCSEREKSLTLVEKVCLTFRPISCSDHLHRYENQFKQSFIT